MDVVLFSDSRKDWKDVLPALFRIRLDFDAVFFVSYIVVVVRMFFEFDYYPSSISDGIITTLILTWSWDERPGIAGKS